MNMTLVTMETKEKTLEINELFHKEFGKTVYVWMGGIMSRYPENHFIWLATGKKLNYTHWEARNPNFQNKNQFCMEIGYENMKWNDVECHAKRGFICEHYKTNEKEKQCQENLKSEIEKYQNLQNDLENMKLTLKQQTEQHSEQEVKYKEEIEKYKKELEQYLKSQQKFLNEIQVKENKEKILQQELENLKVTLKQQEENHVKYKEQNNQNQFEKLQEKLQQLNKLENKKYRDIILHLHQERYTVNFPPSTLPILAHNCEYGDCI